MKKIRKLGYLGFSLIITVMMYRLVSAQIVPDVLFPETTQGFFSITSVDVLKEQWQKTKLGMLLKDPLMKSFKDELVKQIETNWINRLGLTLDDLSVLPTGSISGGMIAVPGKTPGFAIVIGVKEKQGETLAFLERIKKKLAELDVKVTPGSIDDVSATIFNFPGSEPNTKGGTAYYLVTEGMLIITDQKDIADLLVGRLKGKTNAPLKEKQAYKAIKDRVMRDAAINTKEPVLQWYIEPLEFTAAIRQLTEKNTTKSASTTSVPGKVDVYELLSKHGLKGVKGIGGILDFVTGDYQLAFRTMFYAPQPRQGAAMQLLSFTNNDKIQLPAWIPNDVARFTVLNIDFSNVLTSLGPIVDDVIGQENVWQEVLDSLEKDKYGPKINLQKELVDILGTNVVLMTKYNKPITTDSECFVAAIQLKPGKEKEAAATLEKLFGNDEDAIKREKNGYVFWQSRPEAERKTTPNRRPVNQSITPKTQPSKTTSATAKTNALIEEEQKVYFPNGALTAAHGYIFIANSIDYLTTILDSKETVTAIINADDYKNTDTVATKLGTDKNKCFLQTFERSSELVRSNYELIRNGEMPKSNSGIGVLLRIIIDASEKKGKEKLQLEFNRKTMPEFDQIQSYFGTAYTLGYVEEDGWFVEGVQLP